MTFKRPPYKFNHIVLTQWVVIIASFMSGVYVFSPLYSHTLTAVGPSVFVSALMAPFVIYIYTGLLVLSAGMLMVGILRKHSALRSFGLFTQALLRSFNVIVTVLAAGLLPPLWLPQCMVVFVCLILWVHCRIDIGNNVP